MGSKKWKRETLELVCQHDLATAANVLHHLLFKAADLLPELDDHCGQLAVVILEHFDLILQPCDPLQFPPTAFGGRDSIPLPLSLQFDPLLVLHVDGRHGWGTAE